MSWMRDVDIWFSDEVVPHEAVFIAEAYRVVRRRDVARDLVQDAYTTVMQGEKWRAVLHPKIYVLRAVQRHAYDWLRRQRVVAMQPMPTFEATDFADESPDAFDQLSGREELNLVMEAILSLPDRCREVVIMRRIDGIPAKEISQRLGISLVTVERHLARGLGMLCDKLSESAPRRNRNRGWGGKSLIERE